MADRALLPSIEITETGVTYAPPGGEAHTVRWDSLRAVLIETTDQGPFLEDVWWILVDEEGHCVIPQEAGSDVLLKRLQMLPGFDNEAVIAAMGSVENNIFVCWQRQE
jgi:hypothetical protein